MVLFFRVLQPGTILVKSIRPIEPGERLTISHGVNYKQHSREYRKEYLQTRLINCECKYCEQEETSSPRKDQVLACYSFSFVIKSIISFIFIVKKFPIECQACHGTVPFDTGISCHYCKNRIQQNGAAEELLHRIRKTKQKIIEGGKATSVRISFSLIAQRALRFQVKTIPRTQLFKPSLPC